MRPGTTGNGHIYYAGMDSGGGSPTFFDGETAGIPPSNPAEHTKYMAYPQTNKLSSSQASYDAKTGVITLNVPRSDVGNPANGSTLYSVTAFSATSLTPQSATTLFNLTDATTPFDLSSARPEPSDRRRRDHRRSRPASTTPYRAARKPPASSPRPGSGRYRLA